MKFNKEHKTGIDATPDNRVSRAKFSRQREQKIRISIAMATYNGAKYIQEQLDSFVAQTRQPDELVITDDCSTDNTLEIIQCFAASVQFEVICVQNERNLGYTGNFNRALMKATGDLVFLSDQDDVWFPEKIQRVAQVAEISNALVIMNDAALTDAKLNNTGLTKLGQICSGGFLNSSFVMGCCVAVKRDLLNLCLPIPAGYRGHDSWIVTLADGMKRKQILPEVMQWYRRHEENESQFIVNRTIKITPWATFCHRMGNFAKRDTITADSQWEQANLFIRGVYSALQKADEPYTTELRTFDAYLAFQQDNLAQRLLIRSRTRNRRPLAVFNFWLRGGYNQFSGLKSAIRDIIFK